MEPATVFILSIGSGLLLVILFLSIYVIHKICVKRTQNSSLSIPFLHEMTKMDFSEMAMKEEFRLPLLDNERFNCDSHYLGRTTSSISYYDGPAPYIIAGSKLFSSNTWTDANYSDDGGSTVPGTITGKHGNSYSSLRSNAELAEGKHRKRRKLYKKYDSSDCQIISRNLSLDSEEQFHFIFTDKANAGINYRNRKVISPKN